MSQAADELAKARRRAQKMRLDDVQRQILMCVDRKSAKCAGRKQMLAAWKYLKQRLKELGLSKRGGVLPIKTYCLDVCDGGPLLVVQPDGVWYGGASPEVIEEIIQEHLIGGRIVEKHRIAHSICGRNGAS